MSESVWDYPDPSPGYEAIRDHVAFYPGRVHQCLVDDERVAAQAGDFYGGWITAEIVGPFKGGPGTAGWLAVRASVRHSWRFRGRGDLRRGGAQLQ